MREGAKQPRARLPRGAPFSLPMRRFTPDALPRHDDEEDDEEDGEEDGLLLELEPCSGLEPLDEDEPLEEDEPGEPEEPDELESGISPGLLALDEPALDELMTCLRSLKYAPKSRLFQLRPATITTPNNKFG